MPKSDLRIDSEYAPVADRIALFYERFPTGRIVTQLAMHNEHEIVFQASVYRTEASRKPSATGWASERIGDGDINTVACLENTETSAIGRALANLGFTASKNRPSAEEMVKAARARQTQPAPAIDMPLQRLADVATDALSLLAAARRMGFPPRRAHVVARALTSTESDDRLVNRWTRHLREWVATRRRKQWPSVQIRPDTGISPP
jgi:hypothetical protein